MGSKSSKQLAERPLESPLTLAAPANLFAVQALPERHIGFMEETGRVRQLDYGKNVVGWVDAQGYAYRNDFNRTKVGRVDLLTSLIYQEDYNKTLMARVDNNGFIYLSTTVTHESAASVVIGRVEGQPESYPFAACAFILLF